MLTRLYPFIASKKSYLTIAVAGGLLAVSVCGFRQCLLGPVIVDPLFFMICHAALPLLLFMLITLYAAVERGYASSAAAGFQTRIDHLQNRLNTQDNFFRSINNETPWTLTIYGNDNAYWFVNAGAARELGVGENNILGKKPVEIMGAEHGRKIEKNLDQVRRSGKAIEILNFLPVTDGRAARYVQTSYHPLAPSGAFPGGILARDEDVTNLVVERERRESMLRQVLSTLVAVVDRRDPYAAGHSARVGQLSRALAVELNLPERDIEAAAITGALMNFGKVLVSRAILTKTEMLTHDELQRIRDAILMSADILSQIDFGSPVVPSLRQVLEHFDGSGVPESVKGENILITARIVAVANTFVALVSPRAYRAGGDFVTALQYMRKDGGRIFDPRIVLVLENLLSRNAADFKWLAVAGN